ncbi:MAG: sulfotransferase [Phycisphaerae bacterium]|nr:sulfotransferase [Phycisphaerae bacterium]
MSDFVYIMSPSYSGSTLLTFLLGTHPQIATIGELKATSRGNVETYNCSCGEKIRDCPFWHRVAECLESRGIAFDVADFGTHFRCPSRPVADKILRARVRGAALETVRGAALRALPACWGVFRSALERNRLLVDVIKELQGARIFLDGSKDPVRLKYLLDAGYWEIKVIHLVRDGRGTANSYMGHYGVGMRDAASEWRLTQAECERMNDRLRADMLLRLDYDELCASPDAVLDRVFRFVGIDPDLATRDFLSVEHHILGNPMRLRSSSEIVRDDRWKTALTPEDLATFERIAGEVNRQYGYE